MRHVLVKNGVVVQVDITGSPPVDFFEAPDVVVAGYLFDGEAYVPPPVPDPVDPLTLPLPRAAVWRALAEIGISKWDVRDIIAGKPSGNPSQKVVKAKAVTEFEEYQNYYRDNPLLLEVQTALNLTKEQVDAMWLNALGISE